MKTAERAATVSEFMRTDLHSVAAEEPIADAVTTLADGHIHALPVVESSGRFVGVLSTTDILDAMSETQSTEEQERLLKNTMVRELMTAVPATISPTDTLKDASQQMLYQDIHRLFVTVDDRLVGVISQSDIVRAYAVGRIGRMEG